MGRLLGLMIFCIGIGIVIGMLIQENVVDYCHSRALPSLWLSYVLPLTMKTDVL